MSTAMAGKNLDIFIVTKSLEHKSKYAYLVSLVRKH